MTYLFIAFILYFFIGYGFSIYIFGTNKRATWSHQTLKEELSFSKENMIMFHILAWMWLPMILFLILRDLHYRFKRKGFSSWK